MPLLRGLEPGGNVSHVLLAQGRGLRVAAMKPVASGCERTPQGLRNDDALQLQLQLLAKLEELPEMPENPSVDMHFGAPVPGTTLSWQDFQQFADRYTKILTESKVAQRNLEKSSEEQQSLYNKLLAMGEEEAGRTEVGVFFTIAYLLRRDAEHRGGIELLP